MDLRGLEKGGKGGLAGPWINENKGVFNQHKIKVCVSCSCQCPCFPCSSGETTHEVSLALQGFKTDTRELLGGTEDNIASSTRS